MGVTRPARSTQPVHLRLRQRFRRLPRTSPHPSALLVGSFALLIVVGAGLLLLPVSTREGQGDLLTALFTATSAVCVTGLVVVDTGGHWTLFGQAVILLLMQLGGLGFVVGVMMLRFFSHGRLSLRYRLAMQQTGTATRLGGQTGLIRRAVLLTLAAETIGALLLWLRFAPRYGLGYGLWLAVFHSVSAFTNGSFDLFGEYRSLSSFRTDPVVLLTVAGLIITGGLSLLVAADMHHARRWRRLTLDSKLVLIGTVVLLVAGTVVIMVTERTNGTSIADLPARAQILNGFFHSAAARTAGFTTWNFGESDDRTLFFLLGLMFVGGAPGSMAGGIKITTAAVLLAAVWSTLRGRSETTLLSRRLVMHQVQQALAVAFLAMALVANVALAISLVEGGSLRAPFLHLLFEVTSAFGTVGLSTGVTTELSAPSKLLLALTMFVGRLGPVTIAVALSARQREARHRPPSERVRIG